MSQKKPPPEDRPTFAERIVELAWSVAANVVTAAVLWLLLILTGVVSASRFSIGVSVFVVGYVLIMLARTAIRRTARWSRMRLSELAEGIGFLALGIGLLVGWTPGDVDGRVQHVSALVLRCGFAVLALVGLLIVVRELRNRRRTP